MASKTEIVEMKYRGLTVGIKEGHIAWVECGCGNRRRMDPCSGYWFCDHCTGIEVPHFEILKAVREANLA